MGFWDSVKDAAKSKLDDYQEMKSKLERYDDDRLKRMARDTSGSKRLAILAILKDRGYSGSDIFE